MTSTPGGVLIVTSAHWVGDPRLNRHLEYLRDGRHTADLRATSGTGSRLGATLKALAVIYRAETEVVMLPDPELHVLGSMVARLTGKRPVIDIHEDYSRVIASRDWAPRPLRPLIAFLARMTTTVGRRLAWRVVVAAPELARAGDIVVANIPRPNADSAGTDPITRSEIVYVGDVTVPRGALEMVDVLALLPGHIDLALVGRMPDNARAAVLAAAQRAGVGDRLDITGRLPHAEAWNRARGALAGLCLLRPLPAYRNAVATKLWEYMAAGVPPIVSDLPGQAAVVGEIHADLVCSDPAAVAAIVSKLAEDESLRADLVDRGRRLVSERWSEMRPDLRVQEAVAP